VLETNGNFTTVELKINSLKPIWKEKITTKGEAIKKAKTIWLIKSDVFNEINPLVPILTKYLLDIQKSIETDFNTKFKR